MGEEPQQITKEPQGEAAQVQQVTKNNTISNERTAMSNYKEPKESRSW